MKNLISVLAAIGALASASSASAGEISALTAPGIIKVNGDVRIFSDGTFMLEVEMDGDIIFKQTIPIMQNGTSHSEFDPHALSYDVSTTAGILDFTLRLQPGAPRESAVAVDVTVIGDFGVDEVSFTMDSPDRYTTGI